jgi:hypothetical protein
MDTRIDRALNFVARGDWVERDLIRFGIEMPFLLLLRGGDTNRAGEGEAKMTTRVLLKPTRNQLTSVFVT